jgi:acetate kinase
MNIFQVYTVLENYNKGVIMKQSLILVLNCGSSSVKFAIIDPVSGSSELTGLIQCIGMEEASLKWEQGGDKKTQDLPHVAYQAAIDAVVCLIKESGLIDSIAAVGHRVVHGGEAFTESVVIDDEVLKKIKFCSHLAPLHNPANILGIEEAQKCLPDLKQIAVFDTAFHQTMPSYAFMYAVPYEWYNKHGVRRYGFHGTSHKFVTQEAAKKLDKPYEQCAFISAHLGNGCSAAAVLNGKSVDTTMGFTPLEGLVMGTRSGDVGPGLHSYMATTLNCDVNKVTDMLNKESGLLGITGISSDMRTIENAYLKKNEKAILAIELFCYRLAKYIMSYTVPLGRLDALIFTGGIGENGPIIREKVLGWLGIMNFEIDAELNEATVRGKSNIITKSNSPVAMVIVTNEELVIAQDAFALI